MWLDRVSNPGPLALESDMLLTALRSPVGNSLYFSIVLQTYVCFSNMQLHKSVIKGK